MLKAPEGKASPSRRALAYRLLVILGFLVVWGLLTRTGILDATFLPYPTSVFMSFADLIGNGDVQSAVISTGRSIAVAFVIGSAVGIVLGWSIGMSALLHEAFMGPISVLMSTPKSIFLPIFLLMFGLGPTAATAFGAFEASVYVLVNVVGGMSLVQPKHLQMAHAFKASTWQKFRFVVLPSSLPGLFSALWFGIKHAFTGVLIAELFISAVGVGALIRLYTELSRTADAFALILTIAVLAVAVGSLANVVENRLTRTHGGRA